MTGSAGAPAGPIVRVAVDAGAAPAGLARLAALLDDLTPVMDEIGAYVELSVQERFEDARGPGGVPWVPSRRAREEGGRTLTDTRRLLRSIARAVTATEAIVGTVGDVRYAAIHQFGGTIRAKTSRGLRFRVGESWVTKMSVTLPARPFLGIDASDRAEIERIVAGALARAAGPAGAAS